MPRRRGRYGNTREFLLHVCLTVSFTAVMLGSRDPYGHAFRCGAGRLGGWEAGGGGVTHSCNHCRLPKTPPPLRASPLIIGCAHHTPRALCFPPLSFAASLHPQHPTSYLPRTQLQPLE